MYAARLSAARSSVRAARRNFATVVESNGVKVAAVDNGTPTSSLTVLVKAGSRYESKQGVANALKNFAFKSTSKRSALGTVRESDLYGGVLTSSLGREHLALTAEFLRGDEAFFLDVLTSYITSAKFTRHEFQEYVAPLIESDTAAANANPAIRAIELAHAVAFRNGLGSSLYAPSHPDLYVEDVKDFASSVFTKGNVAVIGTGIEQGTLSALVEKAFANAANAPAPSTPATTYYGGENRAQVSGGPQTVFIGFGQSGAPSAELATLAAHLSPSPSVKWSKGVSPLAAAIPEGASVQSVYLPYTDASLVGLLVQAPTAAGVKEAGKAAVQALKSAAAGVEQEQLASAVAKARFAAASAVDSRQGLTATLGPKVLAGGDASAASVVSAFDAVNASGFTKAASALLAAKPTYVAVGDASLPYADELGL
ncbi:ubiquinol-cytochrome C reductase complex core protein 2 [Coprinopsis cinerea okayama7|uniref:Cytochrome b-c1 complex subunit 2, mitochondrial n=1 Tax=Coprinopsis cinerea (strain Okayama-7 / 130 / ATCC MYA-4618 / FGSC 9003) TaxID=240176 RepID=A8NI11_COPC7|nr:ubiquinol-cytochrome C reductase complex core protein 2 [Coprinopsis cinerea okayama7\|eukprot:XP_001833878.1 ubiquinol-cytochrome C reductase complex core protein 2 [Coprinopsis cinerea okayama7\